MGGGKRGCEGVGLVMVVKAGGIGSARTSVLLWRESTISWEKRTGVSLEVC
jgi:hypothetical protein